MTDEMVRRQNLAIVENIAESKEAVVELVKKYTVATKLVDNDYRINLYSQLAAFEGFYAKIPYLRSLGTARHRNSWNGPGRNGLPCTRQCPASPDHGDGTDLPLAPRFWQ